MGASEKKKAANHCLRRMYFCINPMRNRHGCSNADMACRRRICSDADCIVAWHLRSNHGSKDGTYSTTIKAVSESYFSGRGVTVNHVSKWWGFFNDGTIMDSIDNDNPVIIFGSLFNPKNENDNINHAVVAYKYTDHSGLFGETNFTTHYGWNGYENIYVSGTFGSIYILE